MRKQKPLETYEDVKEKALRLLEYRSHSQYELRTKLIRAGAKEEHIDDVLEFCSNYGFTNDEQFAKYKAHDLIKLKKYGLQRVRAELSSKGISDEIISNVLAEYENNDETDTLIELVAKKLKNDFSDKNKDKCIRYFIYRGYKLWDIKNAINLYIERSELDNEI